MNNYHRDDDEYEDTNFDWWHPLIGPVVFIIVVVTLVVF